MAKAPNRPEEDPAEGSREVIDRELARQDEKPESKGGQGGAESGKGGPADGKPQGGA